MHVFLLIVLFVIAANDVVKGYSMPPPPAQSRRAFTKMVVASVPFIALPANAIDPALLKTLPTEGDTTGGSKRLAEVMKIQQESINNDPELVELMEGVSYREYRVGNNSPVVSDGSRVGLEMTVRCSTVTSASEPNGAMIYSTSRDDDLGELLVKIGGGTVPASIEKVRARGRSAVAKAPLTNLTHPGRRAVAKAPLTILTHPFNTTLVAVHRRHVQGRAEEDLFEFREGLRVEERGNFTDAEGRQGEKNS